MELVLFEPEIPPNTGNVARLCAATGTRLNLVEPLGFSIDDKHLKRAGLDYWQHVDLLVWPDWGTFMARGVQGRRLVCSSAREGTPFHEFSYRPDDLLVLGPETRGLSESVRQGRPTVRIPIWGEVRSLNLATAAGVLLYTAYAGTGQLDGR